MEPTSLLFSLVLSFLFSGTKSGSFRGKSQWVAALEAAMESCRIGTLQVTAF